MVILKKYSQFDLSFIDDILKDEDKEIDEEVPTQANPLVVIDGFKLASLNSRDDFTMDERFASVERKIEMVPKEMGGNDAQI